jgi:hypothetical protein
VCLPINNLSMSILHSGIQTIASHYFSLIEWPEAACVVVNMNRNDISSLVHVPIVGFI